ncbi:MAG TPA: tetratricopeptide repeat protein [Flavobacteriales bacterium]|nr:tetratricopeptide repeat protein [Flavobacteriales bacterium]
MKSLVNIRFGSFCALVFLLGTFSCSTEKNKFFNRSFHNTTAKYNGYFNANEVIREALIDFHMQNKDDYTKILPVFIIPDDGKSKSLYAPMDKAIGKTGVVIKKHSMPNPEKHPNKKEEWCKWIDNNWMVMGIGYFYKRDFPEARTRFEYVFKQYQAEPIKYEAWLWEAKTFLELGDFVNAQSYLDKLQEKFEEQTDKQKIAAKKAKEAKAKKSKSKSKGKKNAQPNLNPDMDPKMYDDIQQTWVDFYLRKKEWTKAEEHLKKAIAITKSKKQKARLYFILGQICQQKGDRSAANLMYYRVDKLNPEYEMEFYSRIFRALNYEGGSSSALKRQLLKMARDDKNKDYLDQIYYALAEIEFKENDDPDAIGYLKKSVYYSTNNNRQKGLSYKRMGDYYYEHKKFINAKMYYDSTMANLPQEYEGYTKVKEKSESLKDLVTNLLVIQNEDSLQRMRNMPLADLEKYVEKVILAEDAEKERKRQAEENAAAKDPQNTIATTGGNGWYFYNPTIMAQGFSAFKKAWGPRKLEDNWRRSDKSSSGEFSEDTTNSSTVPESADLRKRIDDRIAKLSRSERDLDAAKGRLIEALYNAGSIYNERLREEKLAVECFNRLIRDYEESKNGLPAHFQLYVINKEDQTGPHATWILAKHPESEYAKIIKNPNYKKDEALARENDLKKYEETFYSYKRKDYENVLVACNDVISKDPKNSMLPKYYYLRAMTYGEMQKMPEFESALSETASKYPKEEVGIAAAEWLNRVRNKVSLENAAMGRSTYIFEDDVEHFFVLVFTGKMGSVNDAKAKISNFNSSDFGMDNLKITNTFLNTDDQIILVKGFANSKKAMDYYDAFRQTDMVKGLNDKADFFVITNKNYASFYVEKVVADYVKFFQENYLK